MSWNDLSLQEKSDFIKLAVKNGVSNMKDIRHIYSRKQYKLDTTSNPYRYIRKFEGGGILGGAVDDETQEYLKLGASLIPGVGLGIDAYDFYKEPTWENAGWLAASTLGTAIGAGALVKSAKMARRAEKAGKAFEKAQSLEKHFHKALGSKRAARNKKYYDRTLKQWSNYNKDMLEKKEFYRSTKEKADMAKVISKYSPLYTDAPIFLEQGAGVLTKLNSNKNK